MIRTGNFFFKYRNWIFILLYAALLIPSPPLFPIHNGEKNYILLPIITGLFITFLGEMIRGLTIGLVYIIRGGREGKPFAEDLVTEGIFQHCRNPLYLGNILMLSGLGILDNSIIYVLIIVPGFIFIYQSMVLAEEDFLHKKFGDAYLLYCKRTNRWLPDLRGLRTTFSQHRFSWQRWILREHTTQFIWLSGMAIILLMKYPSLTGYHTGSRNLLLAVILPFFLFLYLLVRYMKRSGILKAE